MTSGVAIDSDDVGKLFLSRTTSIYDHRNRRYICYIPAYDSNKAPTTNSKWYVYDVKNDAWYEWVFPQELNAHGGFALHKDELYWVNSLDGYNSNNGTSDAFKEQNLGNVNEAVDNTDAITFKYRTPWETAGEPSVFKKFLRQKTWLDDPTLVDGDFTLTHNIYKGFDVSSASSTYDKTFTASTTKNKTGKLNNSKARSLQIEFTNSTIKEAPRITGYEYETLLPYKLNIKKE